MVPCYLSMNIGELEMPRRKEGWEASNMASALELANPMLLLGLGNNVKGWTIPGLHPLIRASAGWCFEDDPNFRSHQGILVLLPSFLAVLKDVCNPWLQRLCEYQESLRHGSAFFLISWLNLPFSKHLFHFPFIGNPIPLTKLLWVAIEDHFGIFLPCLIFFFNHLCLKDLFVCLFGVLSFKSTEWRSSNWLRGNVTETLRSPIVWCFPCCHL